MFSPTEHARAVWRFNTWAPARCILNVLDEFWRLERKGRKVEFFTRFTLGGELQPFAKYEHRLDKNIGFWRLQRRVKTSRAS